MKNRQLKIAYITKMKSIFLNLKKKKKKFDTLMQKKVRSEHAPSSSFFAKFDVWYKTSTKGHFANILWDG